MRDERCTCGNPWPCDDKRWWNGRKHQRREAVVIREAPTREPRTDSILDPTNFMSPLNPLSPFWIGNESRHDSPPVETHHSAPDVAPEHHHFDAAPDTSSYDHGSHDHGSSFDSSPADSSSYDSGGSSDSSGGGDSGGG